MRSKLVSSNQRFDPFYDFLKHWGTYGEKCSTETILGKWKNLLRAECTGTYRLDWNGVGKTKEGILPHSRKCTRLQRWPTLTEEIERRVRAEKYEKTVRLYLGKRSEHQSCPHYCGLVVKTKKEKNVQSSGFLSSSIEKLQKQVGANHVHLFEACARATADRALTISVGTVQIGAIALSAKQHG